MWTPDLGRRRGPRYLAIAEALAEDAASGRLRPGTRLPTHRELAERLGMTVGTVTRAYAEAARRGLVSGEVGRGSFLRGGTGVELGASAPGLVDLSVNHPPVLAGDEGAPLARTLAALARRRDLGELLGYPPEGGAPEHREAGARWIRDAGLAASPEQVLVSSGSQHGMTAVFAALVRPGDVVATEALTYPGMRALAGLLHLRLLGLPLDREGLLPDALERACRSGTVKALYLIPTLQNPTASVMPEGRRREIARIVEAHGVVVVEDDVHSHLLADAPRPLACFAPERCIYLTGTAKSLAPGLRVGFVHAPQPLVPRLAAAIRATTWMAPPLTAEIAATWIRDGTADSIVRRRRKEAAARHRLALEALSGFDLDSHPAAYHLWLRPPEPWRGESFADAARRHGVLVTPPAAFAVGRAMPDAVRVCLGGPRDREELERGISVLAQLLASPAEGGVLAAAGP
jgi:DNA-binding transcriptional MocR family regulator